MDLDSPHRSAEISFGLAQYGDMILHFVSIIRGTLVILPSEPLNFYKVLKAVRRQIEFGDAIRRKEDEKKTRKNKGCAVLLIVLGTGASGLSLFGHLAGLF